MLNRDLSHECSLLKATVVPVFVHFIKVSVVYEIHMFEAAIKRYTGRFWHIETNYLKFATECTLYARPLLVKVPGQNGKDYPYSIEGGILQIVLCCGLPI